MRHALVRPRSQWQWHNCTGGGTALTRGTRGRENRRVGPRGGNISPPPGFCFSLSHFCGLAILLLAISFTRLSVSYFYCCMFPVPLHLLLRAVSHLLVSSVSALMILANIVPSIFLDFLSTFLNTFSVCHSALYAGTLIHNKIHPFL